MATYDWISESSGKYFGTDFPSATRNRGLHVIQRTVSFATAVSDLKSGTAFAIGDTVELMDIPVNTVVLAVFVRVTTASDSGESDDVDFGDASDTTGFIDSMDMTSTTHTNLGNTSLLVEAYSLAVGGGKYYTTADTLDAYFVAAGDTGVFKLTMVCVDVS